LNHHINILQNDKANNHNEAHIKQILKERYCINIKGIYYEKRDILTNINPLLCIPDNKPRPVDDIDIVDEYRKVLNMTSKLSRSKREFVKERFNNLYKRLFE